MALAVFLTVPVVAGPAAAQTAVAEASMHALSIGDATLTELVLPVGVTWRVAGVRLDANTAFASARYERDGVASSISGLTDLTLRVMIPMMEDRGRIIVAGNVPTGTAALSADQIPVAGVITTDLLTLPVRSFGTGAGVTTGFAVAQPLGGWVVGGVLVYRVGSAFEPVVGTAGTQAAEFRPGSELRLRLGVERPSLSGVTVRGAISWSRFADDEADDQPLFSRGDRLMAQVVTEFPFLRGAASVYAWNLYRSGSELMLDATPQPTPSSNLLGAGAAVSHPLTPELTIRPRAELLVQTGEVGFGAGDGWITRLGSAATYLLGPVRLEPAALLQLGTLEGQAVFGLVLRGGVLWQR
ncbi:MAG: hypothetical protein R3314_03485 [Longimicrobiales bacterium]|nr:hypothetical protein [Longimicrobiales bacterium]